MARLSALYAIGFLVLLARTVPAADSIRVLIGQLDSDDYAVREDAQRVLRQLGESAKADLRATAGKAPNIEVEARVKLVLEQIDISENRSSATNRALLHARTTSKICSHHPASSPVHRWFSASLLDAAREWPPF